MPEKRWKEQERRIARLLGLSRRPNTGRGGPDLEGQWLVVEVSDRSRYPQWVIDKILKAKEWAKGDRLGVHILTGTDQPIDVICLDLRDWIAYHGKDQPAAPRG